MTVKLRLPLAVVGPAASTTHSTIAWMSGQGFSTRRKHEDHGGPRRRRQAISADCRGARTGGGNRFHPAGRSRPMHLDRQSVAHSVRSRWCGTVSLRGPPWSSRFLRDKNEERVNGLAVCTVPGLRSGSPRLFRCVHPVWRSFRGQYRCGNPRERMHRRGDGRLDAPLTMTTKRGLAAMGAKLRGSAPAFFHLSWPGLDRPLTICGGGCTEKSWVAGPSPAMTHHYMPTP